MAITVPPANGEDGGLFQLRLWRAERPNLRGNGGGEAATGFLQGKGQNLD